VNGGVIETAAATTMEQQQALTPREDLRRVDQIRVRRETLADMLRSHGEDDLASRALSLTDLELKRIRELGACYAFSERAMATGGSMGGARALCMATIDVLEGAPRDLRWPRTELQREMGWYDLSDAEIARDRTLRLRCLAELQHPRHD
jgi:hypothetical protein